MRPQSAKAKGRKFQQWVQKELYKNDPELEEGDVESRSMGAGGEDLMLSPKARRSYPFSIECKHRAKYAFYKDYEQTKSNAGDHTPLLVCKANHKDPVVIVDAEWFFKEFKK